MCLAILATQKGYLNMNEMQEAADNNPDGFGYAFVLNIQGVDRVILRKAATYAELKDQFQAEYARFHDTTPFLVHFRWATHGKVDARNAHPFIMRDGGAAIHNGIISLPVRREHESDTVAFLNKVVNRLPRGWQHTQTWPEMVERMADVGNKLAFLWPDKSFLVLGESMGSWEQGIWYSNNSHRIPRYWHYGQEDDYGATFPRDWGNYGTETNGPEGSGSTPWQHHPVGCECQKCCDYDAQYPKSEDAYFEWVEEVHKRRAEHLGGPGATWSAQPQATSLAPIIINSNGKGVLGVGRYINFNNMNYIVPTAYGTAPDEEVFKWFESKEPRAIVRVATP